MKTSTKSPRAKAGLSAAAAIPVAPTITEEAFQAILRAYGHIDRIMQPYFAQFGVSGPQWGVLRTLARAEQAGQPSLRLVDLSEKLFVRPPSVTGVVDRLVQAKLVERKACAEDGRAKQIALTDAGRALLERALLKHQSQYDRLLSVLSKGDQKQLRDLLSVLNKHLGELAHEIPVGEWNS